METALAVSQAKYWHLRQLGLFSRLADWQLRQLVSIADLRLFKAGQVIHMPGDAARSVFAIRTGKVKITRSAGGKQLILDYLGEGEIFPDSALAGPETYAEGATAAEDCFLCIIDRQSFLDFLGENRGLARQLTTLLAKRKLRSDQRSLDLLTLDVRSRLARALVDLADRFGTEDDGPGRAVDLRLTQTELAQFIGSTRETTSMAFNAFRRRGWVDSCERQVRVIEPGALATI